LPFTLQDFRIAQLNLGLPDRTWWADVGENREIVEICINPFPNRESDQAKPAGEATGIQLGQLGYALTIDIHINQVIVNIYSKPIGGCTGADG
jgi:hypothetical protein